MTTVSTPRLTAISGVGSKGPACFLVETGSARMLLDLGYGPDAGVLPDVDGVGKVDALLLSHGHRDHAGSLSLLSRVGTPPIYATRIAGHYLPPEFRAEPLPLKGVTDVLGVRVETGRSGHAPGGIWLHLSVGNGLLYCGDYSTESILYAHDPPPPAGTVILDASYEDAETTLAQCEEKFEPLVTAEAVLLPVPADGRGPEIALYFARKGCSTLHVDDALRARMQRLAGADSESLRDGVAAELARALENASAIDGPHGIMLATPADGASGEAARLLTRWEEAREPEIVFTGYLPAGTPAARLVENGRARYLRWNVHPRLSDNVTLLRSVRAATAVPAFCELKRLPALTSAFAPAQVAVTTPIAL